MFQKYMAFNGIEPFEAWVDYRRNGYFPVIPLSYDPARVGNSMPIRAPYPPQETMPVPLPAGKRQSTLVMIQLSILYPLIIPVETGDTAVFIALNPPTCDTKSALW